MKISKPIYFITILLFFFSGIKAQSLNVDLFDIKKGLSHNTVYDLAQDHFGYMWIGTQNGLNKYDGYDITLVAEKQQNELSKEFKGKCITAVFLDSKNNLWAGTRMGFVNVKYASINNFVNYNNSNFNEFTKGHEISRFYEDSKGNVWIATVGAGLFKVDTEKDTLFQYTQENSKLTSNDVFDVIEVNKRIIVACVGGNLNELKEGSFVTTHEMKANSPNLSGYRKRLVDAHGFIWLGTQGTGLYRIDKKSFEFLNYNLDFEQYGFSPTVVKDIIELNDSILYIATDGDGLFTLNTRTNSFQRIERDDFNKTLFNTNALTSLARDNHDNIWIGSYNGGASIIKKTTRVFHLKSPNKSNSSTTSILAITSIGNDQILIGTDGEGFMLYNSSNGRFSPLPILKGVSPRIIKSILPIDENNYLIGTFSEGLFLLDLSKYEISLLHSFLNIWSIKKGPKNHYWLGCLGEGVVELDENFQIVNNNLNPVSNSGNVMDLEFDREGNLWLGTGNEGLYVFSFKNKKLIHLNDDKEVQGLEIRSIKRLSDGKMLVGTEGSGIYLFEGFNLRDSWDIEKGLMTNDAIGFTQIQNQKIWIAGFKGVSHIDFESSSIKNYSLNGIENSNQLNQNALIVNEKGVLFSGGIYGLSRIELNDLNAAPDTTNTLISNINIDGQSFQELFKYIKPIENVKAIELKHNQNSIRLSLFSKNLLESDKRSFEYQLVGVDNKKRILPPGENQIEFTNISPGVYEFKYGFENKLSSLLITIHSPYWKQTWFKLILFLTLVSSVGIGFYIMLARQNERHEQELLVYKNKQLEEELETKNSRLMYSAVQNASKNDLLNELKSQLIVVKSQTENDGIKKVLKVLNRELKNQNYWDSFNTYFNDIDKKFVKEFLKKYGELTQNDQRLVALIRLNLSTNEIASLLNISVRGVEQSKYRLKKKLGLEKEQNLVNYIQNL